jgi:hypothetical protein
MDDYKRTTMLAFHDELEKTGAPLGSLIRGARSLLSGAGGRAASLKGARTIDMGAGGAGVGSVVGGTAGAGIEGVRGYQQAKEQGKTTEEALAAGIGKGMVGGAAGAAGGALLGAGGGALASRSQKAKDIAGQVGAGKWNPLGAISRGAKRQLHGLTGYADKQQLRAMKGGASDAVQENLEAGQALSAAAKKGNPKAMAKAEKELARTQKGQAAAEKAEEMGLYSIPGYAKSMAKNPLETLRAGAAEQWHTAPAWQKALMVGSPAAAVGGELMTPTEKGGPGKGERVGKELLSEAALMASPLPIGAGMLAGAAIGQGGKYLGRGVDYAANKLRGAGNA